jgi:tetratricopeptide (TPR) repeat protein
MNTGDEMNRKALAFLNLVFLGLGFLIFSQSRAEVNDYMCGSLQSSYGPYDYRSDKDKLQIVEQNHLTPEVINLVRGSSAAIGGDLGYTLRAFPNHHVALNAMIRLGEKEKTAKPIGAKYSVECYLQRAMRFRDDDAVVRVLYASYLSKAGKRNEALNQLDEAARLGVEGANICYNMGLIYFDLKEYEKSLSYGQRAYILGYPLPGLQDKLKKAGKWKEPPVGTASGVIE